jgi:hypothetical protein
MNNKSVIIYISAAPALAAEREALARMIAELPVTLAWHIVQTPVGEERLDVESLRAADLYVLVMGADTYAPIGLEWHTAYQAGRPIHAFLKKDSYTPAGQIFIRQTQVNWRPFSQPADLARQVQRLLIDHLLRYAIEYSLMPPEIERLEALRTKAGVDQSVEAEGAGHSAIILSRERFTPSEGVVVGE